MPTMPDITLSFSLQDIDNLFNILSRIMIKHFDLLSETISNKMKKSEHFQWKNRRKWQIFLNKLTHVPPSAICNVSTFLDMKSNDLNWV
jgi:hypothetical protein